MIENLTSKIDSLSDRTPSNTNYGLNRTDVENTVLEPRRIELNEFYQDVSQHRIHRYILFIIIRVFEVISGVSLVSLKKKWRFKNVAQLRIFDVISELYCVLLTRRRRFENKCSLVAQHAIRNF